MLNSLFRPLRAASTWQLLFSQLTVALLVVLLVFAAPVSAAAKRFQERSLYIRTSEPSATTSYTVSFRYMSPQEVGSVDMRFCIDPIPYHACVKPPGLDVSNATLSRQSGESGFSILSQSTNRIVLSRQPSMITATPSSYKFNNIVNPKQNGKSFAIRLKSHGSMNATGPKIDFGSVVSQIAKGIKIETQVPPMLIFCVAQEVAENCEGTNEVNYVDMGELSSRSTLQAQSQMAVGTNASAGFAITASGAELSAGTSVIDSLKIPTESRVGQNQFGINLVANSSPSVGKNPEGTWANAITTNGYGQANRYKYVSGDVVAYSPNVSLMKKFTVSYITNSSESLRAGVYSTTITYVATGRF